MIKKIFDFIMRKGFHIGGSDGKPFDPYYQERTSAMDDLTGKTKRLKGVKKDGKHNISEDV